ncbi:MAG: 30S ribosomal protein S3 [Methanosarcinales archaeon]|nr:30S ribosomal protein S3 [Methanosarcinales archaeon]
MGIERKFVQDGLTKARINEYFTKQLERAGYGGMVMNRTPMGTQITLLAEKPGMVIGKGGKTIQRLTRDMSYVFNVDNPQIEVQEVKIPELNAQMMANRLANALERGWYFRKAGHNMLSRIMDSGALGCQIIISGKLTGPRSRVSKMVDGYIKHAGKPAEELVDSGYAMAVKKLGAIGCSVRIVPPGTVLPGKFHMLKETAPEVAEPEGKESIKEVVEKAPDKKEAKMANLRQVGSIWEHRHDNMDWHPMSRPHDTPAADKPEEVVEAKPVEETKATDEAPAEISVETATQPEGETTVGEQTRDNNGVEEHKHEGYDYWHPSKRMHKVEGDDE